MSVRRKIGLKNEVPGRKKPISGQRMHTKSERIQSSSNNKHATINPKKIKLESKRYVKRETTALTLELFKVIHLDNELDQLTFTKFFLEQDPSFAITSLSKTSDALRLIAKGEHECLLLDYQMGEIDGITLARKIREKSRIPIIIYTGRGSEEVAEKAFSAGVSDYVRKKIDPTHYKLLANRIRHLIVERRQEEIQRSLFNSASEAIFLYTLDGRILTINENICKILKSKERIEYTNEISRQELKKPLQTILYASYLIRHKPEDREELTKKIDESVELALTILDDLKTVNEISNQNKVHVDFEELVERFPRGITIPAPVKVEKRNIFNRTLDRSISYTHI